MCTEILSPFKPHDSISEISVEKKVVLPLKDKIGLFRIYDRQFPFMMNALVFADVDILRNNPQIYGTEIAITASAMSVSNDRTKRRFQDIFCHNVQATSKILQTTLSSRYTCLLLTFRDWSHAFAFVCMENFERVSTHLKNMPSFTNLLPNVPLQGVFVETIEKAFSQDAINLVNLLESTMSV